MSEPLVSVIIPAYNHEKYVQETIMSIINQTYRNIELIIVDDGSKDSTWAKINELQEKCEERFVRTHFETKENEGICKTMNKFLELANGKYIYLIASDDISKPQAIEKECKFLEEHKECSLVVGNGEYIDSDSKRCYWDKELRIVYAEDDAAYVTTGEYLQSQSRVNFNSEKIGTYSTLYCGNYIPNGYMIRKDIFDKIGKYSTEAPLEDFWLVLQISKYAKLKYLDEILYSYRWHENNTMHDNKKISEYSVKTKRYEEEILENIDENEVLPEVLEVKRNGVCYKRWGIPNIFEVTTTLKGLRKIKQVKLLNIQILKYEKSYNM